MEAEEEEWIKIEETLGFYKAKHYKLNTFSLIENQSHSILAAFKCKFKISISSISRNHKGITP